MILLLDNQDSFVFNLDRYFRLLGQQTLVIRSNAIDTSQIERLQPKGIVISPGPKTPDSAGVTLRAIRRFYPTIPILGVCLGHQAIGQAFGARVIRATRPVHGKSDLVFHNQDSRLLAELPNPFTAARYHSLVIDPATIPDELVATAFTNDGVVMAVEHREAKLFGVQFHPESVLTVAGLQLLAAFVRFCDLEVNLPLPTPDFEMRHTQSNSNVSAECNPVSECSNGT